MASVTETQPRPTQADLDLMHDSYCRGSLEHRMAPHAVYSDPTCPHPGCEQRLQGIDFRLDEHGQSLHDQLLRAWWSGVGLAGRCPTCRRWIHFTIRAKRAISEAESAHLPQLPANWADHALILG